MKRIRTSYLLVAGCILLVVAIGLLVISTTVADPTLPTPVAVLFSPRPSPTWDLLPTRIPSPTPTPSAGEPLAVVQLALLRGEPENAQEAWDTALDYAPEGHPLRGAVLREGARLALALGDLETAEDRAWAAIRLTGQDASTWALLGTILARRGDAVLADQALGVAETLDPALASDLFVDRWRAARQAKDSDTMTALAQAYGSRYPEATLGFYYRSAALLAVGDADSVIAQLVAVLRDIPDAPAVVWYTLGEAYLASGAYLETLTVMDVAGSRFAMGDNSLSLATDDPIRDLNLHRAQAYLGINTPARCADATSLLQRWNAPAATIEQAILCQTPTPTMTPWMISQQVTPTP